MENSYFLSKSLCGNSLKTIQSCVASLSSSVDWEKYQVDFFLLCTFLGNSRLQNPPSSKQECRLLNLEQIAFVLTDPL